MKRLAIRVYYEDTDFSGVVYHASYLRFFERGRTEFLRELGFNQSTLFEEGIAFMVRSMAIEFIASAKVDDMIEVETSVKETRGATLIMQQRILRGEAILTTAEVKVAYVKHGKASRIPEMLRV